MHKAIVRGILMAALSAPLAAATTATTAPLAHPSPTPAARTRVSRPHNDLLSAQRALNAAKLFLSKAPNDPAGNRSKAQQAVETALAAVKAQLATTVNPAGAGR